MRVFGVVLGLASLLVTGALPARAQTTGTPPGQPNRIYGPVLARTDNSLQVSDTRGSGQKVTVNVDGETQYARFEIALPADLTTGYLIGVVGTRTGNRITALRISRVVQVEGAPSEVQWKAAEVVARLMSLRGRGGATTTAYEPVIGQVSSAAPLKMKLRDGTEIEVLMTGGPRLSKYKEIALADIQKGAFVQVVPKDAKPATTVTARAVIEMTTFSGGAPGGPGGRPAGR